MNRIAHLLIFLLLVNGIGAQEEVTSEELKNHIVFLTSTDTEGRYPGGKRNKKVVRYITNDFQNSGLAKIEGTYLQKFKAELRLKDTTKKRPKVKTWNVIGVLKGNDPILQNEYIVLGAHYDHLGFGGPSSKSDKQNTIHPGADDNASGTAALLEIAEKLAAVKSDLKRSVLFIAFGAEEQGLLGSSYFVEYPTVPLSKIKLMINMDMVGRLNDQKQVFMGGAGTFPGGEKLMSRLGGEANLNPVVHAGSIGGSDHVSYYKKDISVLGMHTGGHPQYHTPEDTLELINLDGEKLVCDYIFETIMTVAGSDYSLKFIPQD